MIFTWAKIYYMTITWNKKTLHVLHVKLHNKPILHDFYMLFWYITCKLHVFLHDSTWFYMNIFSCFNFYQNVTLVFVFLSVPSQPVECSREHLHSSSTASLKHCCHIGTRKASMALHLAPTLAARSGWCRVQQLLLKNSQLCVLWVLSNSWLPLHACGDEAQGAGLGGAGASSSWEQAQIPWNDM